MSSMPPTEVQQFQLFLQERPRGLSSLDEAVNEFREYQRQFDKLRDMLRVAEEEDARGEGMPFDLEAARRRLQKHIDAASRQD